MLTGWQYRFLRLTRLLWVRAAVFSLIGVLTAMLGAVVGPYIPEGTEARIGAEAVDSILNIIAASMLTVTTFSLSTMVAAYAAATNNVTPRATRLLMADPTTQNVLAVFIGSFLFSLVGIVALTMGVYGDEGRVILFGATILVIIVIVTALLRWIGHLSRLGRVNETTKTVEQTAEIAMRARVERPYLGGRPLMDPEHMIPPTARAVASRKIGYVCHIDMAALSRLADKHKARIYVAALPGTFAHTARTMVHVDGCSLEDDDILETFTVDQERSFDQDPLFGLAVLSEIASRALSPAINDPGTAIDVLGRAVRLLGLWARGDGARKDAEPEFPSLFVPPLSIEECFDHVFTPIGRDGAGMVEVQVRIQKSLKALYEMGGPEFREVARRWAGRSLDRALNGLDLEADRKRVLAAARKVDPSLS